MLSFLFFKVKAQQYFVSSSYTFFYKKALRKIWLNPGLNLTIFRGTGPWVLNLNFMGLERMGHPSKGTQREALVYRGHILYFSEFHPKDKIHL